MLCEEWEAEHHMNYIVRVETTDDRDAIKQLNLEAFSQWGEAQLVEALRERCPQAISMVAHPTSQPEQIVGHIMFSPVQVDGDGNMGQAMGLGPMAVLPAYQGQGVGSQLVKEGLALLKKSHCPFVLVLGHPEFYPRFGFVPASEHDLQCPWPGVPDAAFLVKLLNEDAIQAMSGLIRYRPEFDNLL